MDKKIVPIGGGGGMNIADVFNVVYPVGSLYWSMKPTSPAELFGGTWERIKDRFVLTAGDSYEAGSEGGEATVELNIENMPAHTHTRGTMEITGGFYIRKQSWTGGTDEQLDSMYGAFSKGADGGVTGDTADQMNRDHNGTHAVFQASRSWTGETSSVGDGEAHNNMPPYIVAYCWKRIK